ncbi:MAG: hypothetical protein HY860_00290 [Chlamydiales bacterium]|nr:hypothetical protein [Chlamydiales bacterium]
MVLFAIKRFLLECYFYSVDIFYFYGNKTFRKVDIVLFLDYLFKNPYRISKEFLKHSGSKEIYTYGETPLKTAFQLLKLCNIKQDDHFIDLGAGSGRVSFFIHLFSGAKVSAIENNDVFCKKMKKIKEQFHLIDIEVIHQNYLEIDKLNGSIIYLCNFFLEEEEIKKLSQIISLCKEGTKILTVGFSLFLEDNIKIIHQIEGQFLWGASDIYVQEIIAAK